jgi:hypothetical protein
MILSKTNEDWVQTSKNPSASTKIPEFGYISLSPPMGIIFFVVSVIDWRGRGYQWIRLVVEE